MFKNSYSSPSNIAIVKYWGKKTPQIPLNPSVSFTLDKCQTIVESELHLEKKIAPKFIFSGQNRPEFLDKVYPMLAMIEEKYHFNFLSHALTIHSQNTFPHSTGIASSASAMSAIALSLLDFVYTSRGQHFDLKDEKVLQEASTLSRFGSGSACRSLYPYSASWGKTASVTNSSDDFATPLSGELHEVFKTYCDSVIVVDQNPKKVSSSIGHKLMDDHPYARVRFEKVKKKFSNAMTILKNGDLELFIKMCEAEALDLHAMMMTSSDHYLLMRPGTIRVIELVREFRKEKNVPVTFTLDAGPNVHLLYPESSREFVLSFIENNLLSELNGYGPIQVIHDKVGRGPQKLS